jgi:hypothetical protein
MTCDICGKVINHCYHESTKIDLKEDDAIMKYIDGKVKIICEECLNKED